MLELIFGIIFMVIVGALGLSIKPVKEFLCDCIYEAKEEEKQTRCYVNILTESEHERIENQLKDRYMGTLTPDDTYIVSVHVDYRRDRQDMNRVTDDLGNIYFIEELEATSDMNTYKYLEDIDNHIPRIN